MLIKFLESSKCFDSAYASRKAVLSNNYRAHNSHDLWEIWFSLELEKPEKFGNNVAVSWQMWMKCFSFADTIRSFMNNFLISNLLFSVFLLAKHAWEKHFADENAERELKDFYRSKKSWSSNHPLSFVSSSPFWLQSLYATILFVSVSAWISTLNTLY